MIDFKIFFLTGFIPYILKKIMGKLLQLFGTQGNLNSRLNTLKKITLSTIYFACISSELICTAFRQEISNYIQFFYKEVFLKEIFG